MTDTDTRIEIYTKDMQYICNLKDLLENISDDVRYYRYDIDNDREQYFYTACNAMDAVFDVVLDIGCMLDALDLDIASTDDIAKCVKSIKEKISILNADKK